MASVMGGLCLANSKLGAVHGYAGVLGGMFEYAPHGALCAALLPHVFRKNAEKLGKRASEWWEGRIEGLPVLCVSDLASRVQHP